MNEHKIRIGSRGSPLAIIQVKEILTLLNQAGVKLTAEHKIYTTYGDKDKTTSLTKNPADDFFTDALDEALLDKNIDIAIHSAKDLPKVLRKGLSIFALTAPLDETDTLISVKPLKDLSKARVGTSSLVRQQSIQELIPDAILVDIRGTIAERLNLIKTGRVDAVIVATCALKRLGISSQEGWEMTPMPWSTTPLQGQLAVVGRKGDDQLKALFEAIDIRRTYGTVSLVGAGPGDPELITLKGIKALNNADCVLYDYLVDPRLLKHAPKAEHIYVGKRKSMHSLPQAELSRMLKDLAIQGKQVVRLKGGDPFIFGRGAEELHYLLDYHIPVHVIPGISSATGVASSLGVPLTARGLSSSVAFISGHGKDDTDSADVLMEIPKADTIVFLMGLTRINEIVESLRRSQWAQSTPIMVVSNGTKCNQQIVRATLATIISRIEDTKLLPPALIIAGKTVSFLRELPDESKILYLGTNPGQYKNFAKIIHFPMITISAIPLTKEIQTLLNQLTRFDIMLFTSRFAVQHFMAFLEHNPEQKRVIATKPIYSIGQETTRALEQYGLIPALTSLDETSEGLFRAIVDKTSVRGKSILFPRSNLSNPFLKDNLNRAGALVTEVVVYQNIKPSKRELPSNISGIIFTSPSTVANFLEDFSYIPEEWAIFAKGPRTQRTLREAGYYSTLIIS